MNVDQVREIAKKYDESLQATDERFNRNVVLLHHDGTYMRIMRAFLMMHEIWLVVFTEHHGFFVYHTDDLRLYNQHEQRVREIEAISK